MWPHLATISRHASSVGSKDTSPKIASLPRHAIIAGRLDILLQIASSKIKELTDEAPPAANVIEEEEEVAEEVGSSNIVYTDVL